MVLTFAGINFRDHLEPKLTFRNFADKLWRWHEILVKFSYLFLRHFWWFMIIILIKPTKVQFPGYKLSWGTLNMQFCHSSCPRKFKFKFGDMIWREFTNTWFPYIFSFMFFSSALRSQDVEFRTFQYVIKKWFSRKLPLTPPPLIRVLRYRIRSGSEWLPEED